MASSGVARAEDQPVIAPAPAWVKPVAVPPVPAKADGAPLHVLLLDQQTSFERGRQIVYTKMVFQIQTPQGLAAGNISLPWSPDVSVLTVHSLRIRRGGQVIDVLASGQRFTVVRREQNLEKAMFDGVLTASIQPQDLQVGDILELAFSITASDPALDGHVDQVTEFDNTQPIERLHLWMQWPKALAMRFRQTGGLPDLKPDGNGDTRAADLTLDQLQPIAPPKGAPPRYALPRLVEATDFASWAAISALMAPLYRKAAVLPADGPLHAELERIKAASADPKARAAAALTLVQDRVRYVALMMGAGGYVPVDAATTWSRRYGDCKAKTALLLALLQAMDIAAEPVMVNTETGDGMDQRLPIANLFNHVLVRATLNGRSYWLDGTRTGDTDLDRLQIPDYGWGLPLTPGGATLVRMLPPPPDKPLADTSIRIDATAGLTAPAPTQAELIIRGDSAITANTSFAALVGEARDRALRDYWKKRFDFITPETVSASFDAASGEMRFTMQGKAQMNWNGGGYRTDDTGVGFRADFSRDPGPNRDAPFAVSYPAFDRMQETIVLPKTSSAFRISDGSDVDQTVAGVHYQRKATLTGNVYTIERSVRSLAPEFPAAEAPTAQVILRELAEKRALLLELPGYVPSVKEITSETPVTVDDYINRALQFDRRGMVKEALADVSKAIELDPDNVLAWANRAAMKVELGDLAGAKSDLAKAEAIHPGFRQNLVDYGIIADAEGRPADAVAAYSRALTLTPGNIYALTHRAKANQALGNDDAALADIETGLRLAPTRNDLRIIRAEILKAQGKTVEAIADAKALLATDPDNISTQMAAGAIYHAAGDDAEAERIFLAIKPDPTDPVKLNSLCWAKATVGVALQSALADCDAALAKAPQDSEILDSRAFVLLRLNRLNEALAGYDRALAQQPRAASLFGRALVRARLGDKTGAEADAAAARKLEPMIAAKFKSYGLTL